MHSRYVHLGIADIWSDNYKLCLWQQVELAVIWARQNLGMVPPEVHEKMQAALSSNPIDLAWWEQEDSQVGHDLNAFLSERCRFLPKDLQRYFHDGLTSYDTEEPAFAIMLRESLDFVFGEIACIQEILAKMAEKYRYTVMLARTHGQWAELQTFGKRCLCWRQALLVDQTVLTEAASRTQVSKLSGAIGGYGGVSWEVELAALEALQLKPFYGATQIIPRELYVPVANALYQTVMTLAKIALDIRLGARSGQVIFQEPFGKKQMGSSAMPHKKNTVLTEKVRGLARLAKGYAGMIQGGIMTWEERTIEMSCVERNAWPDLFHTVMHALVTMRKVLERLQVFPGRMLREIKDSRGCYAAGPAKQFLLQEGAVAGFTPDTAYRIVQLAAFNVFEPSTWEDGFNRASLDCFDKSDGELLCRWPESQPLSIRDIIPQGLLRPSTQLDASAAMVSEWNVLLRRLFDGAETVERWECLFKPSELLKGEAKLYQELLGS